MFLVYTWMSNKGKVIPCRWTENGKGMGTNSGESGARNLEGENIWSRVEITPTGGCVKLKTVAEIRWSSAHDILYWIRCWTGNQWRDWNRGVVWSVQQVTCLGTAATHAQPSVSNFSAEYQDPAFQHHAQPVYSTTVNYVFRTLPRNTCLFTVQW